MSPIRLVITRAWSALIPDGVNTFIFELASALIKMGHEVHIISGCGSKVYADKVSDLFDVSEIPELIFLRRDVFTSRFDEICSWAVVGNRLLRYLKPDLTIMNGVVPCWPSGVRIVVCHGLRTQGSYSAGHRMYDYFMYRFVGSLVAVSQALKNEIFSELGLGNIKVIPIGLDTEKYSSLPIFQREPAILHVGTRSVKNPMVTIEAFRILANRIPDAKLYLTGSNLNQYCIDLGEMKDRIFFLGVIPKDDLRELYSKVMLVSAPSSYESFSYATLEAFASGTPVVGSSAIPHDLLIDGYNGYRLDSPGDHYRLATHLLRLMLDRSLWNYMSRNAKATSTKFDVRKIAQTYLKFIEGKH